MHKWLFLLSFCHSIFHSEVQGWSEYTGKQLQGSRGQPTGEWLEEFQGWYQRQAVGDTGLRHLKCSTLVAFGAVYLAADVSSVEAVCYWAADHTPSHLCFIRSILCELQKTGNRETFSLDISLDISRAQILVRTQQIMLKGTKGIFVCK